MLRPASRRSRTSAETLAVISSSHPCLLMLDTRIQKHLRRRSRATPPTSASPARWEPSAPGRRTPGPSRSTPHSNARLARRRPLRDRRTNDRIRITWYNTRRRPYCSGRLSPITYENTLYAASRVAFKPRVRFSERRPEPVRTTTARREDQLPISRDAKSIRTIVNTIETITVLLSMPSPSQPARSYYLVDS